MAGMRSSAAARRSSLRLELRERILRLRKKTEKAGRH
jgi:hypothetical protein